MPTRQELKTQLNGLNITRNTFINALARIGIADPRQLLIGNEQNNSNKIDEIVSSLRSFQNSRFGPRTGAQEMDPIDIFRKNSSAHRTARRIPRRAREPRVPWFLIDISGVQPVVTGVFVYGLSRGQWYANWRRNAPVNAFPLAQITAYTPAGTPNSVNAQMVGKVCGMQRQIPALAAKCARGGALSNSKNVRNQYTYLQTGNVYTAYKAGTTGLAIAQLAKIIKSIGRSNFQNRAQVRADFLELKRNGDYGEVFTLYNLNSNNDMFILKPGDGIIANEINRTGTINPETDNLLNIAQTRNSYFYTRGCFWSTDRPSLFLCILLNIPYVRSVSRGNMLWWCLDPTLRPYDRLIGLINQSGGQLSQVPVIIDGINTGAFTQTQVEYVQYIISDRMRSGTNFNAGWFLMMCVIDTAHDFGFSSQYKNSYQMKTKLKDVIKGVGGRRGRNIAGQAAWDAFVDIAWTAKPFEQIFGVLINALADGSGTSDATTSDVLFRNFIEPQQMCVMWDSGSSPKGELANRCALAAAKFIDPAA